MGSFIVQLHRDFRRVALLFCSGHATSPYAMQLWFKATAAPLEADRAQDFLEADVKDDITLSICDFSSSLSCNIHVPSLGTSNTKRQSL